MAPRNNPEEKIIKAALKLAAKQGWRGLALADIAAAAKVTLATLSAHFPSKTAILIAYGRAIDARVLDAVAAEEMNGESARDRLFDVLMLRFDAMAPDKEALKRITADLRRDPVASAALIRPALQSMGWMLEAASIDSSGLAGAARVRGLALVWASAFRTWLDDEDDQSRTMAELDRRLSDAEALIGRLSRFRRKKKLWRISERRGRL
jgi:AcrR family transcriptional regulator